jgi:hypothetical protein
VRTLDSSRQSRYGPIAPLHDGHHLTPRRGGQSRLIDGSRGDVIGLQGTHAWRAAILLATLYAACGLLFWHAQAHDAMVPTKVEPSARATRCVSSYPCFSPWAYAFDISIPLVNLGQTDNWRPDASALHGNIYRRAAWGGRVLGWMFASLLFASLTGLIQGLSVLPRARLVDADCLPLQFAKPSDLWSRLC